MSTPSESLAALARGNRFTAPSQDRARRRAAELLAELVRANTLLADLATADDPLATWLRLSDLSRAEQAKALGVTERVVRDLRAAHLDNPPARPWTEAECDYLRTHMHLSIEQQAAALGRTEYAIGQRRRRLGLVAVRPPRSTTTTPAPKPAPPAPSSDPAPMPLRALRAPKLLSVDEEQELGRRAQAGDLDARNTLIERNTGLAGAEAKRWMGHGLEFDDLVQYGILGLIRAAERFDPDRGLKFSTYAVYWVRQAIQRAVDDYAHTVRLPVHMAERARAVVRAEARLLAAGGTPPTMEAIADELGLSAARVATAYAAARTASPLSLDAPRWNDDEDVTLYRDTPDPAHDVEGQALAAVESHQLRAWLCQLPPRERDIVARSFGLATGEPETLAEIGRHHGISRERVRQLLELSLTQLRELAERGREGRYAAD